MDAMNEAVTNLRNPMDLHGKSAIVTGGDRGIGFGIATALSQRGAKVAILCRNAREGSIAAEKLNQDGGRAVFLYCDITDTESVKAAVAAAWDQFERIDILVNNAGVSLRKPFIELDDDMREFSSVVDVNLTGTARMSLACAKRMAAAGGGCIINITSVGGFICNSAEHMPMSGYTASKAALNHLTRSLAVELRRYNIRVNGVAPGPTHSGLDAMMSEEMRNTVMSNTCSGRFGAPLEVGAMCAYLASDEAAQIDGSVIAVDGGIIVKS
ncbi:MAG: SDR family oxidoreductase [Clostridiales bacterium]|nr:SDR family oxidoreductase [Clostridiales bacterium]